MIARPDAADVARLAAVSQYPCVSILLPTRPGLRLAAGDTAVLAGLRAEALRRLWAEQHPAAAVIAERLDRLATQVAAGPADEGLALFAAADRAEAFHLTEVLEVRVVVDPTFATRDLLATVHANPAYWLVHLGADVARLFDNDGRGLREVQDGTFPMRPGTAGVRAVDAALEGYLRAHRRPVVVVGTEQRLLQFLDTTARDVLSLARPGSRPNLRALEAAVRPLLAGRLAEVAAAAQETLASGSDVARGLAACWDAAWVGAGGLLLVEQTYAVPARLTPQGLQPAPDREHPQVLDDAVDELVELVSARGGQVRFVPDGSLGWADRIALRIAN